MAQGAMAPWHKGERRNVWGRGNVVSLQYLYISNHESFENEDSQRYCLQLLSCQTELNQRVGLLLLLLLFCLLRLSCQADLNQQVGLGRVLNAT